MKNVKNVIARSRKAEPATATPAPSAAWETAWWWQSLTIFLLAAFFALSACDDSSSASGDNNETSAVESSSSVKDSDSTEESSSSIDKKSSENETKDKSSSSENMSSSSAKETKVSSDSKSSSSVKSGDSSSSKKDVSSSSVSSSSSVKSSSSSAGKVAYSSSSITLATPCKTETEDNCEYGSLTDSRDGQTYRIVKIGNQVWMAENLNYDPGQGGSGSSAYDWSWCYDDDPSNCDKYGRLYTWAAAMDSATTGCGFGRTCTATHPVQGICPSGWHLPDTVDWHGLIVAAGGKYSAGAKLKSTSGWENDGYGNDGNGTDAFGFSALPSGYRSRSGEDYHTAGCYAWFWSSFEYITGLVAYDMGMNCTTAYAYVNRDNEEYGYAVRCVKDSD